MPTPFMIDDQIKEINEYQHMPRKSLLMVAVRLGRLLWSSRFLFVARKKLLNIHSDSNCVAQLSFPCPCAIVVELLQLVSYSTSSLCTCTSVLDACQSLADM